MFYLNGIFVIDSIKACFLYSLLEEKRGKSHIMMASTHWKVERVVALGMVGIMPAALFIQGSTMDHLLTTFVFLHGFW